MSAISPTRPRTLVVPFSRLEKWDFLSAWLRQGMRVSHALRKLGDLVDIRCETATEDDFTDGRVTMVDRVSFGGEIFSGERDQTKMTQFIARPGDLVVSKIRARQGSIGLVTQREGLVSVTIHYRVLVPDAENLQPRYAQMALRSAFCRQQFLAATGGAMKGEISEENLLAISIPLPTLPTQRRIVSYWEETGKKVADARRRAHEVMVKVDARFYKDLGLVAPATNDLPKMLAVPWTRLIRWGVSYNQHAQTAVDLTQGKYPVVDLGSVLALVQYGTSEKANTEGQGTPILRIKNIKERGLVVGDLKHIALPAKTEASLVLEDGDILIIRTSGSRGLVGTCAPFHEDGEYVFASYLIRLRTKLDAADPDFVSWFLNTPLGRQQIEATARKIMQNNINTEEIRALQIPLPRVATQRKIMERVQAGRAQADALRTEADELAAQATTEVEEMILGKRRVEGE